MLRFIPDVDRSMSSYPSRFTHRRALGWVAFIVTLLTCSYASASTGEDWKIAEQIVNQIQLPNIPNEKFMVDVSDTSLSAARAPIQRVIDKASASGGGIVVVPKGTWQVDGPIRLKSKVNLHLEEGATLLFSGDPSHYLPVVKTRWEGTEVFTYSPLIYALNVEDVAITGKGTIDGNAQSAFIGWYEKQNTDMHALRKMGFDGVPVEKRQFGEGHYLRPPLIQFFHAKRVLLEDYTALNSPFWVNHLVYTSHATVRRMKVESHLYNNDGLDIESSQFVLAEDNHFRTGDDGIVIKSGRDADGRNIGIPSTDIVARNNDLGGEDGIGLGSEMSGGIKRVFFENNILHEGDSAYRFKSNLDRGGRVEMVRIRGSKVASFKHLFWFQLNYPSNLHGNFPATYTDIIIEDLTVENVGTVLEIHAPDAAPVHNVKFKDIKIKEAEEILILENADDISFENVTIGEQIWNGTFSSLHIESVTR